MVMKEHIKSKLIGICLALLSFSILTMLFQLTIANLTTLTVTFYIILMLMCTFTLLVGLKLIMHEQIRPIPLSEVEKRVKKWKGGNIRYPALIYICGIDGAGKTTQINMIKKHLDLAGLKHKYVWLRWASFISYPFLAICRILGYTRWKVNPRNRAKYVEHYFYKNKAISSIWKILFTLDLAFKSFFKVKIPLKRGCVILSDRYVIDAIVDLMIETRDFMIYKNLIGKLLFSLIPNQSIKMLIDLDEQNAFFRKNDIPNIKYLEKRRNLYLHLANYLKMPIINGRSSQKDVNAEIFRKVLSHHPLYYILLNSRYENLNNAIKYPSS